MIALPRPAAPDAIPLTVAAAWKWLRELAHGTAHAGDGTDLPPTDAEAARLLDLYLPLCAFGAELAVAHLGQSLDGFIATGSGDSKFVTGPANIEHVHRMRALCDAVIVGRATVEADDPLLTTRLVEGANPVRVVVDPGCKLSRRHRVFDTSAAPTFVVCAGDAATPAHGCEIIRLQRLDGSLPVSALLEALHERGLRRVFVEGGGVTVSRFLQANALDRLQITVAPVLMGSGVPATRIPAAATMRAAWRPPARSFRMGEDAFYEFDLRGR